MCYSQSLTLSLVLVLVLVLALLLLPTPSPIPTPISLSLFHSVAVDMLRGCRSKLVHSLEIRALYDIYVAPKI